MPAMQAWSDGLGSVLDAVGSRRCAIFAMAESALPVMLYAASHPERVRALALWAPYACYTRTDDRTYAMPEEALARYVQSFRDAVGTGILMDRLAPSWSGEDSLKRWWARNERLGGGPGYFARILELFLRTDVRPVLGSIQAPTLLMRRRDDWHVRDGHAREIANELADARLVELPGDDHAWFAGDAQSVLDEIEGFLTGERGRGTTNRVLSTVLFTDIVGSTEKATRLGDTAWTTVLEAHNRLVQRHVESFRGSVVKFTGDGTLATFDGPARAIQCACELRDAVRSLDLEIRAGLHTGEVEMLGGGDVGGIAVHLAARILAVADPGEVLVSGAVPPLVLGSGIGFEDRGSHELRGVPEPWPVFAVL
jgi:class 3 adenylate cyclase